MLGIGQITTRMSELIRSGQIAPKVNPSNWGSVYGNLIGDDAWVDNATSPTIVHEIDLSEGATPIDGTTEGNKPSSPANPLVIDVKFSVNKSYNGNAAYHMDIFMGGGGFGSGFVSGDETATKANSRFCVGHVTYQVSDGTNKVYGYRVVDMNPGVGPTYQIIRVGTPSITYTFSEEEIMIYEVQQFDT